MRTIQSLLGASVFFPHEQPSYAMIVDVCCKGEQVDSIVVKPKHWFKREKCISFASLKWIDGKWTVEGKQFTSDNKPACTVRFLKGKNRLSGQPAYDERGETVGLVENVYFLPETGRIVGYEVTEGLYADFLSEKLVVKTLNKSL
ncbi:PRC-barrel domain-containing protein [Texcoconibacillus texcoconensis]|uniref:Uncharacterized protein YrrD n=1 Tax=Texcoconibacillus texcoconensis TaxID=1095777 RepID=A0A840QPB4_9BACI|nr:PRC-barrel domain-containing protein [Texcoconibacillus texcoconensis]MBB5173181.1 uncharacterized protein YrrD [Texcoconibacillus texcoconensis]